MRASNSLILPSEVSSLLDNFLIKAFKLSSTAIELVELRMDVPVNCRSNSLFNLWISFWDFWSKVRMIFNKAF